MKRKESEDNERKKNKASDVKSNQPVRVLLYKEVCLNTNELNKSLPSVVVCL